MVSFRGKNRLGQAPLGFQFKIPEEHPRPFRMCVSQEFYILVSNTLSSTQRNNQSNKQTNKLQEAITFVEI